PDRPGAPRAGSSSSRHRSSSTGVCDARSPISTPYPPGPVRMDSRSTGPLVVAAAVPSDPHPRRYLAPGKGCQEGERLEISRYGGGIASQPAGQHPLLDDGEVLFAVGEVAVPGLLVPDLH